MGAALQKLNSKRGASIVLALMFFLICAVIGSIVLFSAYSNAGRLSHIRGEQQAYLAVSSAARLVRGELDGQRYQVIEKTVDGNPAPPQINGASGSLEAMLNAWAKYVFDGGIATPDGSITVTSNLDEVSGGFSMDGDYNITVELSLAGGQHPITVKIPAGKSVTSVPSYRYYDVPAGEDDEGNQLYDVAIEETITTTTTITWGGPSITKGGA